MTRTPLSRSKGQGHQAALLTAVLARQAAAAVGVGTCWPWETAATFGGASAPTGGGEGWRHIVAAARLQLVNVVTATCYVVCELTLIILQLTMCRMYIVLGVSEK